MAAQLGTALRSASNGKHIGAAMRELNLHHQAIEKVISERVEEQKDDATRMLGSVLRRAQKKVIKGRLKKQTLYAARGMCDMAHKVLTMRKKDLKKAENDGACRRAPKPVPVPRMVWLLISQSEAWQLACCGC